MPPRQAVFVFPFPRPTPHKAMTSSRSDSIHISLSPGRGGSHRQTERAVDFIPKRLHPTIGRTSSAQRISFTPPPHSSLRFSLPCAKGGENLIHRKVRSITRPSPLGKVDCEARRMRLRCANFLNLTHHFVVPPPQRGVLDLACWLGPRTALTLPMSFTTVLPFHYPEGEGLFVPFLVLHFAFCILHFALAALPHYPCRFSTARDGRFFVYS